MKTMLLLLILGLYGSLNAQVTGNKDELHIVFKLKHKPDDPDTSFGIHWDKEKPMSDVVLKGKSKLKYAIRLENDSIATLHRYEGKKLVFQDSIWHDGRPISFIEGTEIFSEFVTTDFDEDGDEDLLFWIASNVNGNVWTVIYLNDQNNKKLVKLMNNADHSEIWDNPHYHKKKRTIECELFSGAYGFQSNYTFKLEGLNAIPVYKEERDLTSEEPVIEEFIGENGQWKLVKED